MKNKCLFKIVFSSVLMGILISSCGLTPGAVDQSNGEDLSLRLTTTFGNPEILNPVLENYSNQKEHVKIVVNKPSENDDSAWLLGVSDLMILSSAPSTELLSGLVDLEPYISSTDQMANKALFPALDGCKFGGKQYGLPLAIQPNLLYFNAAMLQEYGLSLPTTGITINDLKLAIDAIGQKHMGENIVGFLESPARPLLKSLVSRSYDNNKDYQTLKNDLIWYVEKIRHGVINIAGLENYDQDWTGQINNGKVAYWFAPYADIADNEKQSSYTLGGIAVSSEFNLPSVSICIAINQTTARNSSSWDFANYLFNNYPLELIHDGLVTNQFLETNPAIEGTVTNSDLSLAVRNTTYRQLDYSSIITLVDRAISNEIAIESSINDVTIFDLLVPIVPETIGNDSKVEINTPPSVTPQPQNDSVSSIKAFIDPVYLTDFPAIKSVTEAYNQNNPTITTIDLQADRVGFSYGYSALFDAENYDCFAAPAGLINSRIDDESIKNQFSELILPLDPLLDRLPDLKFGTDTNILTSVTLNGEIMGYPVSIIPKLIYFNKTELTSAGIAMPNLDWDTPEFWEIMNKVADISRSQYGYAPLMIDPASYFSDVSYLLETPDGIMANYSDSEIRTILEMIQAYSASGAIFPYYESGTRMSDGNYLQRDNLISQGNILFWSATPYSLKYLPNSLSTGEKAEVEILPLPGKNTYGASEVIALFISRSSKNPQGCLDWFNYLAKNETQLFEGIPLNSNIFASASWQKSVGENKATVYRYLSENLKFAGIQEVPYSPFRQWWNDLVYAAYMNQNLDSEIALIQEKASNTLACLRDRNSDIKLIIDLFGSEVDECAQRFDPTLKQ